MPYTNKLIAQKVFNKIYGDKKDWEEDYVKSILYSLEDAIDNGQQFFYHNEEGPFSVTTGNEYHYLVNPSIYAIKKIKESSECPHIVAKFTKISQGEVEKLTGIHTLTFDSCDITNINNLGSVHTLLLRHCQHLTNISWLQNIHVDTLSIVNCQKIPYIPKLNVSNFTITDCQLVEDVSELGKTHTVCISNCQNVRNVSMLGGVHTLSLVCCKNIKSISDLRSVSVLNMYHCNKFTE